MESSTQNTTSTPGFTTEPSLTRPPPHPIVRILKVLKEHIVKPEVYLPAGAIIAVIILITCIICRSRRRRPRKPSDSTDLNAVTYTKSKKEGESEPDSPGDGQTSINIDQTSTEKSNPKELQAADKDDNYPKIESQFQNHKVGENGVVATTNECQSSGTENQTNNVPNLSDTFNYVEVNVEVKEDAPMEKDVPMSLVENPYDVAKYNGDETPRESDHDYGLIQLMQEGDYDTTTRQGENKYQNRGIINSSPYDTIDIVNDVVDENTRITSVEIKNTTV